VKKSLFILTLFILLKPFLPIVEYVVNYEYISKVLCVNKQTPTLGCDGKCYLMSQLAKSAEDEKPISDKKFIVKEVEILFFQEIKHVLFLKAIITQKPTLNFNYCNLYNYLNSSTTFHPPTIIS
jgi:hypothetical protein